MLTMMRLRNLAYPPKREVRVAKRCSGRGALVLAVAYFGCGGGAGGLDFQLWKTGKVKNIYRWRFRYHRGDYRQYRRCDYEAPKDICDKVLSYLDAKGEIYEKVNGNCAVSGGLDLRTEDTGGKNVTFNGNSLTVQATESNPFNLVVGCRRTLLFEGSLFGGEDAFVAMAEPAGEVGSGRYGWISFSGDDTHWLGTMSVENENLSLLFSFVPSSARPIPDGLYQKSGKLPCRTVRPSRAAGESEGVGNVEDGRTRRPAQAAGR